MPSSEAFPIVLVPGLLCSARLYAPQVAGLWPLAPVQVADHRRDDDVEAVAARILRNAPPRFALAGLSYGGYVAFAMMRQAPDRIVRLALLDTQARADSDDAKANRLRLIGMAEAGKLDDAVALLAPRFLHQARANDPTLRGIVAAMAAETGADAFVRQQKAIMSRPDARRQLASIACPTLVLVGDGDELTPPDLAREMADGIPGARLTIVPDCGHLSTLEQPDAVNAALAGWLTA